MSYDERWSEGTSIELDEALGLYEGYVSSQRWRLSPHLYVNYRKDVDRNGANQALGFSPASPKKWAGQKSGTKMMIPELDEVTVEFEMVV